jgi:methyl-accepting chemotaxis protein
MMSVVNAIEGMENISEEVKKSAEIIQRLGIRSVDIEKILSVIKDVTEQTNLLSLNAAILAAQAGEYGKSFSVVADEIRGLSERTSSSTREIGGIVKTIQQDIKDAVFTIDSAKEKVEEVIPCYECQSGQGIRMPRSVNGDDKGHRTCYETLG